MIWSLRRRHADGEGGLFMLGRGVGAGRLKRDWSTMDYVGRAKKKPAEAGLMWQHFIGSKKI
jgi:hypothetical protein